VAEESVTYCHNCKQNRLCRHYQGYWICVQRCWRYRRKLVPSWRRLRDHLQSLTETHSR